MFSDLSRLNKSNASGPGTEAIQEYRSSRPRRVIVDASHTIQCSLNGGVQRVVRNVYRWIPQLAHQPTTIVVNDGDGFQAIDVERECQATRAAEELADNIVGRMPQPYVRTVDSICRAVPHPKLRKLLLPEPGHKGIFRGPLKVYSWFSRPKTPRGPIEIQQGDLLILPDAYWAYREIWPAVERARERGAYVASVVFDLIPRTHPSFVADGAAEAFDEYLSNVVENSDLMIAISNTVRNQLETLVPSIRQSDSGCRHFRSFELGAEFRQVGGFVRPEIKKVFSEDGIDNPHLMVSTFDPRKNHMYLLDAFDRIWAEDPTRKLCLIGRIGWLCQDVLERIWSHPLFSRQLFAFHDVSDEELSYCYQKSRSICFPSIVEGFGLPIVEALWYGKHVFASDTAIHREVGKDECHYCDLNDSNDLAIKLLAWERMYGPQSPSRQSSVRPITWRASIQSLLSQCLECYAQDQMRRPRIAA